MVVKTKLGLNARQQDPKVGNFKNKSGSPQDFQSIVDLYLVEDEALKKDVLEMLSKHKDL